MRNSIFPLSPMDGCLCRPMTGGSMCTCSMNNSIAIALDQHDKRKEALAACDASLNFTHSPLCRRASRAATPPRSPSRDQVWKSRPNPSGARFLQFNEGRLLLRRRVDHAGVLGRLLRRPPGDVSGKFLGLETGGEKGCRLAHHVAQL